MHLFSDDLVESTMLGGFMLPLIANIPLVKDNDNDTSLSFYSFNRPIFKPVKISELHICHFSLLDYAGRRIRFAYGSAPVVMEINLVRTG